MAGALPIPSETRVDGAAASHDTKAPSRADRVEAALLLPLVGDAACVPLHWVYDAKVMEEATAANPDVAFASIAFNPFYRISLGLNSCYGDQYFHMLDYVAKNEWEKEAYSASLAAFFETRPEYDPSATASYHVDGTTTGKLRRQDRKEDWPIDRPWMHHSIRVFLENWKSGKRGWPLGAEGDEQMDGAAKVAPLAVKLAAEGDEVVAATVREAIRSTQNDRIAEECGVVVGRALAALLRGEHDTILGALEWVVEGGGREEVVEAVKRALASIDEDHAEFVRREGNSCHLPGGLASALHGALHAEKHFGGADGAFEKAISTTIRATGCNASRSCVIGALLGARFGTAIVPPAWVEKTRAVPKAKEAIEALTAGDKE